MFKWAVLAALSAVVLFAQTAAAVEPLFTVGDSYAVTGGYVYLETPDVDNDGHNDMLVADRFGSPPRLKIWLGNGDGTFRFHNEVGLNGRPISFAVMDIDDDGNLDIGFCLEDRPRVQVLKGTGTGDFLPLSEFATGAGPSSVVWGDFDRDERIDAAVVLTNGTSNATEVWFFQGDGTGQFVFRVKYFVGDRTGTHNLVVHDVNHDSYPDLMVALTNGRAVRVLLNNGQHGWTFSLGPPYSPPSLYALNTIHAGDLNGDGALDLISANNNSHGYAVYLGDPSNPGRFTVTDRIMPDWSSPMQVAIADFDQDGDQDFAVGDYGINKVIVLRGNGGGAFAEDPVRYSITGAYQPVTGDYNEDGLADLAVGASNGRVTILLGRRAVAISSISGIVRNGCAATEASTCLSFDTEPEIKSAANPDSSDRYWLPLGYRFQHDAPGGSVTFDFKMESGAVPGTWGQVTTLGATFDQDPWDNAWQLVALYDDNVLLSMRFVTDRQQGMTVTGAIGKHYGVSVEREGIGSLHCRVFDFATGVAVIDEVLSWSGRPYDGFGVCYDYYTFDGQSETGYANWDSQDQRIAFKATRGGGYFLEGWMDNLCLRAETPGLPGIPVTAHRADDQPVSVSTDPFGRYVFPELPLGMTRIEVQVPPGYLALSSNPIWVELAAAPGQGDFDLAPPTSLTGTVYGCTSGVAGLLIEATDGSGSVLPTTTDETGNYRLEGLVAGLGSVQIHLAPGQVLLAPPTPQVPTVLGCGGAVQDFSLICTAPLAGTVTNACGGVVAEVQVSVTDSQGDVRVVQTDALGVYGLPDVRMGQVTVRVLLPSGYVAASDEVVSVEHGQVADTVNFTLNPLVVVSGTIEDCHGPLDGVDVQVVDDAGTQRTSTSTSNGVFSIGGLTPGDGTISIVVPAGHLPQDPPTPSGPIHLACQVERNFKLDCVAPVTGTVSTSCGAGAGGINLSLTDVRGDHFSAATNPQGEFMFPPILFGRTAVSLTIPDGYVPADSTIRVFVHDGERTVSFAVAPLADLSGVARACQGPLENLTVDLVDGARQHHVTITGSDGRYVFTGLYPGEANLSYVLPLGYAPLDPTSDALAIDLACDMVQNLDLACQTASGSPRSMGYWKHQVQVYLLHKGSAQESEQDMTTVFPDRIFNHFHENQLNSIDVEGVSFRVASGEAVPVDLSTMYNTLWVSGRATMLDRAKQQYLSALLNIASGKQLTRDVIAADGRTVSQAVQYIAELINDGIASNDELAKNIAETLNLGGQVVAGIIPDRFDNIPYKQAVLPAETRISPAVPNPFWGTTGLALELAQGARVQIQVYDAQGRVVAALLDAEKTPGSYRILWDGRDAAGQRIASGIYYVDVRIGDRSMKQRLVLVR